MNTKQAYDLWASQYDTNNNRTRDLEALALRESLAKLVFRSCLEIGCGTGKNTVWLVEKAIRVTAVDLSDEMLALARQKITSDNVSFLQSDITAPWSFRNRQYDLVTFSLVLEHIQNLDHVFKEASEALSSPGYVYVGELHPFKQYAGTKARFDTDEGRHMPECFDHHVSDFVRCARRHNLVLTDLGEYFDDDDRNSIPRILTLLFRKE